MDRNDTMQVVIIVMDTVALRKESVDRNIKDDVSYSIIVKSLSARRAWIEIEAPTKRVGTHAQVALRKESVDRNIASRQLPAAKPPVALRKESVDRNTLAENPMISVNGRSPQGERG